VTYLPRCFIITKNKSLPVRTLRRSNSLTTRLYLRQPTEPGGPKSSPPPPLYLHLQRPAPRREKSWGRKMREVRRNLRAHSIDVTVCLWKLFTLLPTGKVSTISITNVTPRAVLFETLIAFRQDKKFPVFCGPSVSITGFTRASHRSYYDTDESTTQSISVRSILIISTHPHRDLPSDLFPPDFPTKILKEFPIAPMRATCPAHFIFL
jgi:hypothetical protein